MTLTQLRYFQAVCRFHSVTQASDFLHISQPSISSAIRDLEQEFGVVLFLRQYRGMSLTEEGLHFLELADSLLAHADQVRQAMADIGQKRRQFQLGIPPMIGSLLLPQIYYGFLRAHPEASVNIEEAGRKRLLQQLAEGQLDMAFLPHDQPFDSGYRAIPIQRLETVCCVSLLHPLVNRRSVAVEDLAGEPLVLFKNSFFQTESIMQRFAVAGIEPNVLLYTDQLSTVRKLVSRNIAVGFMFGRISDSIQDMVSIPLNPPMPVQVSLVWKSSGYLFSGMSHFIDYVQSLHLDGTTD